MGQNTLELAMRKVIVEPGMRVQTTGGEVVTVATVVAGRVYAYSGYGWLKAVEPVCEAWGGEHDMEVMNAA